MRAAARLDRRYRWSRPADPREAELFAEALDRPVAERARYLDQACQGQPELRAEIESLLRILPVARKFFARRLPMRLGRGPIHEL